ncbi:MAG: methyltransferase [Halobellus sp.]|uniref:methyltransferase n=1 Tax=Halobellus sp. TaxID=1979212 RepID=UPI0035D43947
MPDSSSDPSSGSEQVDAAIATSLIQELQSGQLLYTGAKLGMFEVLDECPTTATDVAAELGLHTENTYRLLRALSNYGVLEESDDREFSLTVVGELFLPDHPRSVRDTLLFDRCPEWVLPYLHLPALVRDGPPDGFVREFGRDIFEYVEANPEYGAIFSSHMSARSRRETDILLETLADRDFSRVSHVCDVGGGHGHLLSHLLDSYPHLDGTVLDLPSVIAETDQLWAPRVDVENRCTYVGGDMFEAVPPADAYFLNWVLHNWNDEECGQLLSNITEAAPPDGRIFIMEAIVPGPEANHYAKRLDIDMMVHTGGRERTVTEHETLLDSAGWELVERWDPDGSPISVLEAAKV